jgi:release factor glutamine methyltransferase
MKAGITTVRKELSEIYSQQEIDSLIVLIFEKIKGYSRTQLLLKHDEQLSDLEHTKLEEILVRLKKHEPIQYVLGTTEFYGIEFRCVSGVLIPRPETEELVDWIIKENKTTAPTIMDMGTGTGCIAISLQKNIPDSIVFACDVSPVCLKTAKENAELSKSELTVIEYDILNNLPEREFPEFDIIVSNPPYVRDSERALMEKNVVAFEPGLALFVPDNDPLVFYFRIASFAAKNLKNGGRLYFEINEVFGEEICKALQKIGFTNIDLRKDINGKDRMVGCSFYKD